MPKIKSAKKRVDVAERNRQRNVALKSAIKTAMKKALNGDIAAREEGLKQAFSLLDRAVLKGVLHKNTAARYKSRIAVALHKAA